MFTETARDITGLLECVPPDELVVCPIVWTKEMAETWWLGTEAYGKGVRFPEENWQKIVATFHHDTDTLKQVNSKMRDIIVAVMTSGQ